MVSSQFHYTKQNRFMPFLLAEILNFQGSTHRIGVGSFSYLYMTKLFLQQYVGIEQDNEKELRELFEADSLGESVLQKFAKIPKDFE